MFSATYSRGMTNIQDPHYNNVSVLLHMNGTNNSTTFTDSSTNNLTISANGNAKISTSQSKFGGSSASFDGSSTSYLYISDNSLLEFGTSNFTMEASIYFNNIDTLTHTIIAKDTVLGTVGSNTGREWIWRVNRSLQVISFITFAAPVGGAVTTANSSTFNPSSQTWYNLAISRIGTTVYFFVDGISYGSGTIVSNMQSQTSNVRIGCATFSGSEFPFNGYIDELRITKNIARFTQNYTSPAVPFLP